jgi:hypothetical protein
MKRIVPIGLSLLILAVACGDDDATTMTQLEDRVVVITIDGTGGLRVLEDGEDRELGGRISVDTGTTVRLLITLGSDDEVHVHTYDQSVATTAGAETILEFVADIPGVFEVELEDAHTLLFELEVA